MNNRQTGFTLVELMVTLAVAIIMLAVGMPLFSGMAANNRATTEANTFLAGFKMARSEAIKRAANVSVCAIADPTADPLACGTATANWRNGLLVFTDGGAAGSVDGTDERVKAFARTSAGSTITAARAFFTFDPLGEATNTTNNANCPDAGVADCIQLGTSSSGSSNTQSRCLTIRPNGQVRLERTPCS